MSADPATHAYAFVGAFVDELVRAGVRHVCAAPGSRSTPLALTVAGREELKLWMHLDERSAAFFALGLARAAEAPVAVLCTSGTAAANFFPAIVEAQAAGVPLLVLTADRPPELREVGAAQTIDQNRLYGAHVKWFVEVPIPDASPALLRHARVLAQRAVASALSGPPGPVHLNFPFREPLVPQRAEIPRDVTGLDRTAWTGRDEGAPYVRITSQQPSPSPDLSLGVAQQLRAAKRPIVVCGPQYDPALGLTVAHGARELRIPVLADPLAQVRWGPAAGDGIIEAYDALLRIPAVARTLAPDFVIRIGGTPTSKALLEYLAANAAVPQVVLADAGWPDPMLAASLVLRGQPAYSWLGICASGKRAPPDDGWRQRWITLDAAARKALLDFGAGLDEPFEGRALAEIAAAVPGGGTLFVSSSMPVRDLDTFGRGDQREVRVLANRGANGIDGVVSTALGAAAAGQGPLVLAIGDVALYHDMNGLLAAKQHGIDATIVLLNNDGGGIFSFLPQAAHPDHFERLFGTPHGLNFSHAARLYGAGYFRADRWDTFRTALRTSIGATGLTIIEMRTERARNVELHRLAREAVARAVDPLVAE